MVRQIGLGPKCARPALLDGLTGSRAGPGRRRRRSGRAAAGGPLSAFVALLSRPPRSDRPLCCTQRSGGSRLELSVFVRCHRALGANRRLRIGHLNGWGGTINDLMERYNSQTAET